MSPHANLPPSLWVCRWAHLVRPGGQVLDVACGSGRHVRWLAQQGFDVTGLDRDAAALAPLRGLADVQVADLEGEPWPLPGAHFDAVVVTNYLWRALWPHLLDALADGGVLIYETFADGNQSVGKPSRPDFLLRHGELLQVARALRIVAYEDGFIDAPPRYVQRIAAVAQAVPADSAMRYPLYIGPGTGA
jgi:SAM-dependent methyltransferase